MRGIPFLSTRLYCGQARPDAQVAAEERQGRSNLLPPTADSDSSVHRSAAKEGPSQVLLGGGGGDEVWEGIRFQTLDMVEEALFASTRAFVAENKAVEEARSRVARGEELSTKEMVQVSRPDGLVMD